MMAQPEELEKVEELIRERGVVDVRRVATSDVVTAEWVRMKCQYGCGGYDGCLTCPPHSPGPAQTRKMLDEYSVAFLMQWGDSIPGRKELVQIELDTFLMGYYKALLLACGPCGMCNPCPLEHPCRFPDYARPSMEACGIDVYETARRAGFPLEVVRTPNYYSLLLVR
jgi:predicted metal-binding protein